MSKKYDFSLFVPGVKVRKKTNTPFKSTFQVNTIATLLTNPHTGLPGASFVEDVSIVDLRRLKPASEGNGSTKTASNQTQVAAKDQRPCPCCGQTRPYPTEPGEWQFCEQPYILPKRWASVTVKLPAADDRDGQEGLRLWQNGEMIWWPSNSEWRKVEGFAKTT